MPSNELETLFLFKEDGPVFNIINSGDYKIGYFLFKSPIKTSENEDVLFIDKNKDVLVFGVADGAGGHPKGQEAAYVIGDEILNGSVNISNQDANLFQLIENVNDKVRGLKVGAKSTLAFATIINDFFRCYSVGDSEVIYWNGVGGEVYNNVPHSNSGYRIEAGVIEQEESLDDPERHVVTNLVGDESIRIESTSKFYVKKGHTILIGSDGLFDNISHETLGELVAKGGFEKAFEDLVEVCKTQNEKEWKKHDDIAFILVRKVKPS